MSRRAYCCDGRGYSLLLRAFFAPVLVLLTSCLKQSAPDPIPGSPDITDLSSKTFNSTLLALDPKQYAVIEFYASWCPHCRRFAPEYKRAAAFLARQAVLKPLFIGKIDCAIEVTTCNMFKVDGYPQVTIATVQQFIDVATGSFQKFPLKFKKTHAKHVVAWVGSAINITLPELTDTWREMGEGAAALGVADTTGTNASLLQWDLRDVESATIMMMSQSVGSLNGAHARSALMDILNVWAAAHPSSRCMEGAEKLQAQLPGIWPAGMDTPGVELRSFHICGDVEQHEWAACKGSKEEFRGYTCGLWTMWHAVTVRLPEANGGVLLLSALHAFATHFFQCDECRHHFSKLLAVPLKPPVLTRRDAVLWLWRTHNKVNARLAREEEAQGTGDPAFPKVQFPPALLCARCQRAVKSRKELQPAWDEEAVLDFLVTYYGPPAARTMHSTTFQSGSAAHHDLVLGADGQAKRASPSWPSKSVLSGSVRTWLAVLAMALIMAWYCSKAKGHKGRPWL